MTSLRTLFLCSLLLPLACKSEENPAGDAGIDRSTTDGVSPGDRLPPGDGPGPSSDTPLPSPDAPKPKLDTAPGAPLNPNPPGAAVRLVFIHHSVGEDWSSPFHGGLIGALNTNKYYLSDTNYGWGPDSIGDRTDIGHWHDWFLSQSGKTTYLPALYKNTDLTSSLAPNAIASPGGENTVVMFKSCFVSGDTIHGNPGDAPLAKGTPNPIYGKEQSEDQFYTVANIKGLYRDLLDYFATRQDRLFVLVTTPPSSSGNTTAADAANLRAINTWLVRDWLKGYAHANVAVFDFYNVLTSNGGSASTNDLGAATGSHHRYNASTKAVEHLVGGSNFAAYAVGGDDHPTDAGHKKATAEYLPLLNIAYHCWKGSGGCPTLMGRE